MISVVFRVSVGRVCQPTRQNSAGGVPGTSGGGGTPRCAHAAAVATRPRGVRASIPARTRNGSQTSSTVPGSSPTATASVDTPTGPPPNAAHSALEHRPVEPVEAELVDVVDAPARPGRRRG